MLKNRKKNWFLLVHRVIKNSEKNEKFKRCSVKQGFFKFFAKSPEKHLYWCLFQQSYKSQYCIFIKERLQRRCFHLNFAKFSGRSILQNFCEQLLLKIMFIWIQLNNNWQNLLQQFSHARLILLYHFHQKVSKEETAIF